MPGITDNDQALLEKVIATLPYLNGLDPNKRMPVDFGTEKPANNRFYGPKVMKKARHLVLLYLARNVEIFKTRGKVFGHLHYFTRTTLEKVAGYDAFKPDYIKFVRQRADKDFEDYRKQGLVELKKHQGQKYWSLTPKGVKAATRIINNLLQCLPTDKVPRQTVATESLGVLSEYPLLSFSEYVTRKDVEHILKYKKFTGRDDELRSLNNLISSGKKIFALVGPSGIGKTRLMLEFSRELSNNKSEYAVYFIHPNLEWQWISFNRKTLLILDDASRYKHLDKLVDYVLNHGHENDIKLLLIDKSKDSIRTHTDLFFYTPIFEEIREGDISKFLTENFSWLDANTAAQIRELCNGNFYIAILYAHYFKEENSLDEPNIIANWWITKNVEDICVRNNFKRTDVRFLLRLISLLMPLNWEQDKERLKFLPPTLYNTLENIVQAVYINYEEYPFLYSLGSSIQIQPDLMADFFRRELIDSDVPTIEKLINYMPYRIARNVKELLYDIQNEGKEDSVKILNKIWIRLNTEPGFDEEYFIAVLYFTGNLVHQGFIAKSNLTGANPNMWLQSIGKTNDKKRDRRLERVIAGALYNLTRIYGAEGFVEQMEDSLDLIVKLYNKYSDRDVRILLASGFAKSCGYFAKHGRLEDASHCLQELEKMFQEHEGELIRPMANCLVNLSIYHILKDNADAIDEYYVRLRTLYQKYPHAGLEEQMLQGVYNAANYYRSIGDLERWKYYLSELKVIADKIVYPFLSGEGYSILQGNEADKLMKMECVKAVRDYDLFLHDDEIILTLDDYALPQGDKPDTEILFHNFVLNDHIFLRL